MNLFKKEIISLLWADGTMKQIKAYTLKGLAAHRKNHTFNYEGEWEITHITSGYGFNIICNTLGEAKSRIRKLVDILDWTKGLPEVEAEMNDRELRLKIRVIKNGE